MLAALTVRDIVLIEQAALEFAPGLNVLTGETGAGKSILLDSLGLAIGGRGRAGVRPGAAQGSATAVFDPGPKHASRALLLDQAMTADGEIVLRRSLSADGKSRAFINDEAVGVGLLKELGGMLLEIHGQSDDRGLFDIATHRGLLDSFGGLEEQGRGIAALYAAWDTARQALSALKARAADAQRNAEFVRAAAATKLEEAVAGELTPLKLGHAKFRVTLTADEEGGAHGLERIAFEVATVEGAAFGSLAKIASGGELARFSLALKVALAQVSSPAALVFDEVDRGVGGAVADAVGERLQRLAETTQVLLVTHSPQVAARAARHFRISRVGDKTRIVLLEDDARLEEIARMLSGANVTEEARAAARRLVAEAAQPAKKSRKRA